VGSLSAHLSFYPDNPRGQTSCPPYNYYPNKHITIGEGGMVVTDDNALADKARSLRNLCFQPAKRFVHERLG